MNSKEFRAELVKIMPGYSWTVHKDHISKRMRDEFPETPVVLTATGIQSSGSNRLSTLEVSRREDNGHVTYAAKSSGYGTRARWLHEHKDGTLARALRGLQDHYVAMASTYASHAGALKHARAAAQAAAKEGAQHGNGI